MLQEVQTLVHLTTYFFDSRGFVAKYLLDIIFTVKKKKSNSNKQKKNQTTLQCFVLSVFLLMYTCVFL